MLQKGFTQKAIIGGIIGFVVLCMTLYCIRINNALDFEPVYTTLYKISMKDRDSVEIRAVTSSLSKDEIVILKNQTYYKSYDYHLYKINKITIQDSLTIYVKAKRDSLRDDTLTISFQKENHSNTRVLLPGIDSTTLSIIDSIKEEIIGI